MDEAVIKLKERDMLTDTVLSQSFIASCYRSALLKSSTKQVRSAFSTLLKDVHSTENEIDELMKAKGWCSEKPAEKSKVSEVKNKFCAKN